MSNQSVPDGYFLDAAGKPQKDRRKGGDRRDRNPGDAQAYKERRKFFRRKMDREIYERDHKAMIEDALEEFAEDHEQ